MSVVVHAEGRRWLYCKGAPEVVLALCDRIEEADGETPLDELRRKAVTQAQDQMARQGVRVLGFAWRELVAGEQPVAARRKARLATPGALNI